MSNEPRFTVSADLGRGEVVLTVHDPSATVWHSLDIRDAEELEFQLKAALDHLAYRAAPPPPSWNLMLQQKYGAT